MANTVIGIFDNVDRAREAAMKLEDKGYASDNIDVSPQGTMSESRTEHQENSFSKFFKSLFEDEEEAGRHTRAAYNSWVVTVHTQSMEEAELAADILDQYGALNADELSMRNQGEYGSEREPSLSKDKEASIPVIEESMEVGKREVETGGLRLRSRIVERPVEEHLRLREEHITVERNPVDRPVSGADLDTFREGTIEATEKAEVPVVNKAARVVEEVKIKKEVEERDETIRGSVRKQDVEVERKSKKDREPSRGEGDLI